MGRRRSFHRFSNDRVGKGLPNDSEISPEPSRHGHCPRLRSWSSWPSRALARAQESWDAVYLGGSKIGYIHVFIEAVKDRGRDYLRVRMDTERRLKRRDDVAVTKLMYGTIETLDGQVLKLDTRTQAGGDQDIRAHGDVINGEMKLILESGGRGAVEGDPLGPRGPRPLRGRAEHGPQAHEGERDAALADVHPGAQQGLRRDPRRRGRSSRSCWETGRSARCSGSTRPPSSTGSLGRSTTPGSTSTPAARCSSRSRT